MAFGSLAALFVSFGFEGALNVHLPRLSDNIPKLRYLFKQMLIMRVIVIIVFFLLIWVLISLFQDLWLPISIRKLDSYLYLAFISGFISLISGLITRTLVTLFRVKYLSVIRIIYLTATLIIYFYLLTNGYRIKEILWAAIITSFLAVILYIFACRDLLAGTTKKFALKKIYKFGFIIWTNDLLGYLLGKDLDIVIMTFYGVSTSHIGFYQITFILIAYARMIITKGMTGVLQSAFSSAFHNGGVKSLGNWWKMTMKFQILVVAPGVLFIILFARQLFESLLPNYIDATILLQTFGSFALVISFFGGGTNVTVFYAMGKEKIVLSTRTLTGVMNLILDIILIYYFGVMGAIIATGAAGTVVGCLELSLVFTNLRTKYPAIFLLKCLICLILAGFVASSLKGSGIPMLVFCGIFYYLTYLGSAWLVKPFDREDIISLSTVNSRLGRYLVPFSTNSRKVSIESL